MQIHVRDGRVRLYTRNGADWAYERQLAGALLDDTRLYKQAAEARGLESLAGVMPAFGKRLSPQQLDAISQYLAGRK